MKTTLVASLLCLTQTIYSQESVPASGGNGTSSTGSFSYTIGQVIYTTVESNSGSVVQGVQQSLELLVLSNLELSELTLSAITYPNPTRDFIVLSLKGEELQDVRVLTYPSI